LCGGKVGISSSGCEWGYSLNHSCLSALEAVIRFDGSNVNILFIKSIPKSVILHSLGMISFNDTPGYLGKLICAAI